jgi:hypothetical protein
MSLAYPGKEYEPYCQDGVADVLIEGLRDAENARKAAIAHAKQAVAASSFDTLPEIQTFMPSLEEANVVVNGERQDQYGAPEDSFEIIAGYWNVMLRQKIKDACKRLELPVVDIKDLLTPLDTTNMMVLFKQARKLGQRPKRDNYVDSIGYEAIGADRLWEEVENG